MLEFRVVRSDDAQRLADVFSAIDNAFFRPHPFTDEQAEKIANYAGRDVYAAH